MRVTVAGTRTTAVTTFTVPPSEGVQAQATSQGPTPGVDLYLRDNADGSADHWRSPDVKIDAPPYDEAPKKSADFDRFHDEAFADETNRAYVRVLNRGTKTAEDVRVTLYAGAAATMLPRLDDERAGWLRLQPVTLDRIDAAGAGIATFELPSLPFGHQCLLIIAGSLQDPAPSLDEPGDRAVASSGNVTARNMFLTGTQFKAVLVVRNPTSTAGLAMLEVKAPDGVRASLPGPEGSSVELEPGEQCEVTLSVSSETRENAEVTVTQSLESPHEEALRGGTTYLLRP